ncbi:hypothetical protein QBC39DRAFT_298253 [Podospora conica]|nr:hypothetical protein QBC39DRAFT_298253 [Schizothecium conicum]
MRPLARLRSLRPLAWKPLAVRNPACLRFHGSRVAPRYEELVRADALKYPRIQNDGTCMSLPVFREKYGHVEEGQVIEEEVTVRGRLRHIRNPSSKLSFMSLASDFAQLQAMFDFSKLDATKQVTLESFKQTCKLLKRGDIVSITGKATRTPTGELTIVGTGLPQLLTPSLVPLPYRLQDEDKRIRNRHIDMLVHPSTTDTLRLRSHLIRQMRDFFHARSFLEVQTPILASAAGGAVATPFTTTGPSPLALRIAPELWLKRLVVGGLDRVFELGPSFRNEGLDHTHNPEFTTCEFYQSYASLPDLLATTESLLSTLASTLPPLASLPPFDPTPLTSPPYHHYPFLPTLTSHLPFPLPDLSLPTALPTLRSLLVQHTHPLASLATTLELPALLDKLAAHHIEPLSLTTPIFITHHPVCLSPLSKSFRCPTTGQLVAARAELFYAGVELANMYEEENDPFAQRDKFVAQAAAKDPGEPPHMIDEGYVEALESGLPPTGGWGCGVERLVMLFSGAGRIGDVLSFGSLRNVVGVSGLRVPAAMPKVEEEGTGKKGGKKVKGGREEGVSGE